MTQTETATKPRAMSKSELAAAYGICANTLNNWFKRFPNDIIIDKKAKILTPDQVKIIYEKIGEP